jgi:uncharacterized protein DUF6644
VSSASWESVHPFFLWAYHSAIGTAIRESTWGFAWLEVFHLFGLTILLGSIIVRSLRLAGLFFRNRPMLKITRALGPWTGVGMILMGVSGALMFASDAMRYYESVPFHIKLALLLVAFIYHFTWFRKATREEGRHAPWVGAATAALTLLIWISVGLAGRAIAFF